MNLADMIGALRQIPPLVTQFEVPPAIDAQLRALATIPDPSTITSASSLYGVPWTVDPELPARQIRCHYSDGTTKVVDL